MSFTEEDLTPEEDAADSLRTHIITAIDNELIGKVASTGKPIYSSQDHTTPAYVRNASCWAADYVSQLTAISPWNSDASFQKAGVLVSPRHVLFATHYLPAVDSTIRFVKADNTVVTRTITDLETLTVVDAPNLYPDITVGLLDSDVGSGINFAKVLTVSFTDKLPPLNTNFLPCARTDQEEKLLICNLVNLPTATSPTQFCSMLQPADIPRLEFYENMVGGDSGSPVFFFINGEMVLLTVMTNGGQGSGTSISAYIDDINAAMTTLGGGYQLTPVDISTFPDV